jgi:hypothetical protein
MLKVVAGAGIEPATQGFSVHYLTVHTFSEMFTPDPVNIGYLRAFRAKTRDNKRTVYDSSEH